MKRKPIFTLLLSVLLVAAVLVGGTMAYLYASDAAVVNEFKLADVDTEIEEDPAGGDPAQKTPTVLNQGDSEVYVRARAVVVTRNDSSVPVSESDVKIRYNDSQPFDGDRKNQWQDTSAYWKIDNDGWFYYTAPLKKGESTEPLFDGVEILTKWDKPNDVKFDIYVYHESVVASAGDNCQDAFNPSSDGSATE